MDRGVWWATIHGVAKESDMTKQLNNNSNKKAINPTKSINTSRSGYWSPEFQKKNFGNRKKIFKAKNNLYSWT